LNEKHCDPPLPASVAAPNDIICSGKTEIFDLDQVI